MAKKLPPKTAIDLFCGCGGMTVGLKRAGFQVLAGVDIDTGAIAAYRANHLDVNAIHGDIRTVSKKDFGLASRRLDLLAACPPCQGFSSIRTRNGSLDVEDARNDLICEVSRITKELRPRAVMIENVPGLSKDARFADFLEELAVLGYQYEWKIINAADYGVPQRRKRLILVGFHNQSGGIAPPRTKRVTVRTAIGKLPKAGNSGDLLHDLVDKRTPKVQEIIANIPKNGGSRSSLPAHLVLDCHKKKGGFYDVYGRMAWNKVSPTITSGCNNPSKGRFIHPTENRAITLREAALLQGFPRHYRFPVDAKKKGAVALMIGNALPPPLICAHARHIKKQLQKQHKKEGR